MWPSSRFGLAMAGIDCSRSSFSQHVPDLIFFSDYFSFLRDKLLWFFELGPEFEIFWKRKEFFWFFLFLPFRISWERTYVKSCVFVNRDFTIFLILSDLSFSDKSKSLRMIFLEIWKSQKNLKSFRMWDFVLNNILIKWDLLK